MGEYQLKLKVATGNLLPPYFVRGVEVYEADTAKDAIAKAKQHYASMMGADADDYPLVVEEVTKL